ncbi:MAG: GNAT family N-acetyltransferase [Bifidobacterium sp.]|nr:GNAT family N-acetyltransferase [Bifidobacterium sp.]MCH4175540.1 GNAT family N-acetyltransferase [Bifidobacterium sp.]
MTHQYPMLTAYNSAFKESLEHFQLADLSFTGSPAHAIHVSLSAKGYHPILLVTSDREIPTFLVLDYGDDKYRYTDRSDSLLIRSFSTDDRFHRRGFALHAMTLLPDYVRGNFSDIHELVLGVNERNKPAQQLYERSGFTKISRTYQGAKGKQFIYRKTV